jgi:hypothetical protein
MLAAERPRYEGRSPSWSVMSPAGDRNRCWRRAHRLSFRLRLRRVPRLGDRRLRPLYHRCRVRFRSRRFSSNPPGPCCRIPDLRRARPSQRHRGRYMHARLVARARARHRGGEAPGYAEYSNSQQICACAPGVAYCSRSIISYLWELGGDNDTKNLWLQPAEPRPGDVEKDQLETTCTAVHATVAVPFRSPALHCLKLSPMLGKICCDRIWGMGAENRRRW